MTGVRCTHTITCQMMFLLDRHHLYDSDSSSLTWQMSFLCQMSKESGEHFYRFLIAAVVRVQYKYYSNIYNNNKIIMQSLNKITSALCHRLISFFVVRWRKVLLF